MRSYPADLDAPARDYRRVSGLITLACQLVALGLILKNAVGIKLPPQRREDAKENQGFE